MFSVKLSLTCIFPALILLSSACTSGTGNGAVSDGTPAAAVQRNFDIPLPPPSQLKPEADAGRMASYTEEDLYRPGKFYDVGLPNDNVSVPIGDDAVFSPAWQPGSGLDGLAYCMFSFPAFGFDRELELHYSFTTPPADWGTMWLGAADFDADRWIWRSAEPDGDIWTLLTLNCFSGDGTVYVVFACTADGDSPALDWVHLGPPQVEAQIQTFIHSGVAPVEITADASASSAGIGEIDLYEWDWDGDGTYDEDSGDSPVATHTYTEGGEFLPTVRVTSSLGATATAQTVMEVIAPWVHTYGTESSEFAYGVTPGPEGEIYFYGNTNGTGEGGYDALLLKYLQDGTFVWARTMGGEYNDQFSDMVIGPDGAIYLAGRTYNANPPNSDLLIQEWDTDGNLVWSRVWDGGRSNEGHSIVLHGGALYVAGSAEVRDGEDWESQAMIARFDLSGNTQWVRTFGDDYVDVCFDIEVVKPLFGETELHATGYSYNSLDATSATYARLDDSGTLQKFRRWVEPGESVAYDISVVLYPERKIFIAGYNDTPSGGDDALLVEYQDEGNPIARSWGQGGESTFRAAAMEHTRGGYVLAGTNLSGLSFLLAADAAGNLIGTRTFGQPGDDYAHFHGLAPFPGQGVAVIGKAMDASGIQPGEITLTTRNLTGYWEDLAHTMKSSSSATEAWGPVTSDYQFGVHDTGAGSSGDLLMLVTSKL